jgi:hypothetical protein
MVFRLGMSEQVGNLFYREQNRVGGTRERPKRRSHADRRNEGDAATLNSKMDLRVLYECGILYIGTRPF